MKGTVTLQASEVKAWRGMRGSGDMMRGAYGALVLTDASGAKVEIEGTSIELVRLQERIYQAMTAADW